VAALKNFDFGGWGFTPHYKIPESREVLEDSDLTSLYAVVMDLRVP
jgi:hypothetical protein